LLLVGSALEYECNGNKQRHRVDDTSATDSSAVGKVRRVQLDPNPLSVAAARDECDDLLHDLHVAQDMISTACVIVSELVSNAVLHARTASELALEAHGRTLRVEVTDASIDDLHTCGSASTSLGGRGLQIVDAFSDGHWGVVHDGGFKCVWAELDLGSDALSYS